MNNIQIIPAILATSEEEYLEKLKKIQENPELKSNWVQIDLMDNKFVQNKSIGFEALEKYSANLRLEAHLMVKYPESWIDELIKLGVKRIIFPVEDADGIDERIAHLRNHGIEVGLSINPETPVAKVVPFIGKIDLLLIMSVDPGFGGQEFISETLNKVREAAQLKQTNNFKIEVDGGINETVANELVGAGADNLVIGEHLFNGNISQNLEKIIYSIKS